MKKAGIIVVAVLFIGSLGAYAQEDKKQDDIKKAPTCKYCGADVGKFAHSRIDLEYEDAPAAAVCGLHCAAVDLSMNAERPPTIIRVADYNTKKMIDAGKASWVVGGKKPGVLCRRAKWAFEKKEDAEKFVKENGGMVAPFDAALKYAFADMYADLKMVRDKQMMKKAAMAKRHPH